jgi:hypothetical protein
MAVHIGARARSARRGRRPHARDRPRGRVARAAGPARDAPRGPPRFTLTYGSASFQAPRPCVAAQRVREPGVSDSP